MKTLTLIWGLIWLCWVVPRTGYLSPRACLGRGLVNWANFGKNLLTLSFLLARIVSASFDLSLITQKRGFSACDTS
jgi:hypothetical protein